MAEQNTQKSSAPNFSELEQQVLKVWDDNKIFEKSLQQTKDAMKDPSASPQDESLAPFIFYDGPPFATGLPHYGSILPSVIKDAIPRYQTMKGRYVRRRWGWDCHGLPIENIVEKNLKISGKKQIEEIGVARFNQVCRENVLTFAQEWGKTIHRIARWVDFENSYKTMDTSYQESVWWGLKQVWEKGLIYEDHKVLLYCSRCETPISNFEVAMDNSYRDITEESVYAKFKLLPRQRYGNNLTDDKTFMVAWTTTPWTLPGNTSLNVGADINYVVVEQNGEKLILAKDRLAVLNGEFELVTEISGRALESLRYEPLYSFFADYISTEPDVTDEQKQKLHKVYLANFVTTVDGTGIVHNAAMYGEEDYQLAKEKNLPRKDLLDNKGKYLDFAPENLRGQFFKDADKIILAELTGQNKVYKTENYLHSYPHCYRCGTPLFYNALPAWFINIQKIKPQLVELNKNINWYPEHLKFGRFQQGIENAPDWNISRNRYWATALPFWKCESKDCKNLSCVGSIEELIKKSVNFNDVYPDFVYGTTSLESLDLHKPYIDQVKLKCEKCGDEMDRVPEVVDCWVESGSMPFAELHYPFENKGEASPEDFQNRFPSDFVVEYIPQTRAWFYVMHVVSTMLFGKVPFKNVMTTGTILGEDGTKMSKSKGNYPDANIVIDKYGADALRFYLLTSPVVVGEDVSFSEKSVQEVNRKLSLIFYNVWTFYRTYEKGIIEEGPLSNIENVLDKWILARLHQTHSEVTKQMDNYNTVKAGKEILDFINDFSTWYLRRSRDRIKESNEQSKSALRVLGFVLAEVCKMLAPFMPFISDFIYRDTTGKESVHLAGWSVLPSEFANPELLEQMELAREVSSLGLSARKNSALPVRQPLRAIMFSAKVESLKLSSDLEQVVLAELNIKEIDVSLLDKDTRPDKTIILPGTLNVKDFYLDPVLTEELKREGLARELERQVQDLRKKSGLKVGELVDVYYNTTDDELENVLLNLLDRKKTFVSQIKKSLEVEVDFEMQAEVSGKAVWIGMIKI